MHISFSNWNSAIKIRRSRRKYEASEVLRPELLSHMRKICEDFRPFPEARSVLVTDSIDKVFERIIGSYGIIRGAPAFVAFIGDTRDPHVHEKIGYTGEGVVLEATSKRLGTCWVAGTFNRKVVSSLIDLTPTERVSCVTPIGYSAKDYSIVERTMRSAIAAHDRKPLSELVSGIDRTQWPDWMRAALEAARIAPSAMNRQPWRFYLEANSITISLDTTRRQLTFPKRLDCGIAMLHIAVAALASGVKGTWEFLDTPQVARFTVT